MAVPKRKVSKSRRDKRRSSVWKIKPPTLIRCDNCLAYKPLHKVCEDCGYYKGKQVIKKSS
ncbi:MAG: 50S ribosomal protein L32 [Oscillospiraceae bacterium]|nr:50S ribosomal protein L32 [Oscillospiraceae bacterium]